MKIKLNKLVIKSFKGIDKFVLEIGGENASVIGENATGKTSLADSFYWLLTDQNLERKAKFGIIKNGYDRAEIEGEIFMGSKLIRPQKIYRVADKGGFTSDYYIDGMEMSQREYKKELNLPDDIRLISDVHYFMSLPIAKRRDMLFSLVGKVKDNKIFEEYENLKPVKDILKGRDFLRVRKTLVDGKNDLEKELKEIPIEIRTLNSIMPPLVKRDEQKLRAEIDLLDAKIADIKHGGDLVKRIALLESEQIGLEADIKKGFEKEYDLLYDEKMSLKKILGSKSQLIAEARELKDRKQRGLSQFKTDMENLIKRWKAEKNMKYKPSMVCYACKQELPQDQITRQIDEFNKDRAETLKQIDIEGKELRKLIDALENEIPLKADEIDNIQAEIDRVDVELRRIEKKIEDIENRMNKVIEEKREQIDAQIKALTIKDQQSDLYKLEQERSKIQVDLNALTLIEKTNNSIDKLNIKRKEIASEIESIDKNIWLLDEFNRKKAEYIEGIINDRFTITDWKLFELLQNGNIRDICEPYFDGVPYIDLNTGAKINIGLDICNTFANHIDVEFPIFIDNSESITNWIPTQSQQINLIAMKGEKNLKIIS